MTPAVTAGHARSGILDEAAEWQADLIVLGSHGRKGIGRFFLGSVSEAVARHAIVPCRLYGFHRKYQTHLAVTNRLDLVEQAPGARCLHECVASQFGRVM